MASKKKNIYVNGIEQVPVPKRQIEIVERKGIGHPDSVADGIAETVSESLCAMYIKEVGHVLHHNTDQTEVVAGISRPRFGGGVIVKPVYVLMDGRATTYVEKDGKEYALPVETTALKGVRKFLKKTYPYLDVDSDIILDTKLGMGSDDLTGVYKASNYLSNDTSFGVGYAPFSVTDELTKRTENYINGKLKKTLPEVGQDVKVMCSRVGKNITMTIAAAMVDRFIDDPHSYKASVEQLTKSVQDFGEGVIDKYGKDEKLKVDVNTGDDYKRGVYYLTVTGLSQEMGDDGSVGRGNRCNGLITPFRPMSMEATSGKNPITHVGKIYNVLSNIIAKDVAKAVGGDAEINVRLLSQIGHTISDPLNASINIISDDKKLLESKLPQWQSEAYSIAAYWLDNIDKVSEKIIAGKIQTF
ncbi:MAG: methionine adenosyltransferase [Methanomethylophilus sp.]|jgi:S-adenosylmethionine synthetase